MAAAGPFDRIRQVLASLVHESSVAHGVLALVIEPGNLRALVQQLKDEFQFDLFTDVTAVDWLGQTPRFEVVWHFYSTQHKVRVRVKARVADADPTVETLVPLYGAARYMERECHDMYGIAFRGNDDLRPILLYEGFVGHPLRKDYPKQKEQPLVPYREGFAPAPQDQVLGSTGAEAEPLRSGPELGDASKRYKPVT
jgi:NADH-quinone oxidoreductase subunit C